MSHNTDLDSPLSTQQISLANGTDNVTPHTRFSVGSMRIVAGSEYGTTRGDGPPPTIIGLGPMGGVWACPKLWFSLPSEPEMLSHQENERE